jgi:hypothetical protein
MSNKNFGEPWEGKIERIRENLREGRYALQDGIYPIVKELIQNAEDALATRLLIAWEPGLPKAEHPLLRGPGLLAINDGKFDAANGRAIREMGLSSKAADASTIGKFGLGMKSVFHLAEVFFFVAVNEAGQRIDADIRSPWSADQGGLHPDWDEFGERDQAAITTLVHSLFGRGQWFCLWLPLRTVDNCASVDPIESFYPGDQPADRLLGHKQLAPAASIVPMLAHLQLLQIRIHDPNPTTFDIRVGEHSTRRIPLTNLPSIGDGQAVQFAGQVTATVRSTASSFIYSGAEQRLNDSRLAALERDENKKWPKRFATDSTTGQSRQVPEKARQHAAVCFTALENSRSSGQLRIHWAVFLPLGQPETIELTSAGWDVDLMLHGWFFPNSGRTEVEGLRQNVPPPEDIADSASVRLAWNHRLATAGTLPLLPAAFADIAHRCDWNHRARLAVTGAIQRSHLFARFRDDVCRRDASLRRLTKGGAFEWQMVPAQLPVLSLPITHDETLPGAVFPTLFRIVDQYAFVLQGSPRLTASAAEQHWPVERVRELLPTVSARNLMQSPAQCDYFLQFLSTATTEPAKTLFVKELIALARSAIIAERGKDAKVQVRSLGLLLNHVPNDRCIALSIDITDGTLADLFLALCDATESVVWIPQTVVPEGFACAGSLDASEALRVLRALAGWTQRSLSTQQADRVGIIAAQIIRATRGLTSLLPDASELLLFSGTDCRERSDVRLSWKSIFEHHRRSTLFVKPSPMAYQLQDALAEESILLISRELADAVFGGRDDAPQQCREGQMLAALTEKPALAVSSQRRKLFETMLKFADGRRDADFRNSVRYLLHARPTVFASSESLLVPSDSDNNIWWRIARLSVADSDQQWRIVDPAFARHLSAEHRSEFGIEVVGADEAERLATNVAPDAFGTLHPSESEYSTLLKHIVDDQLLKRLPIHRALDDQFVSLTDRTYWEGKWSLPAELQPGVCILARSTDEPTWRRQQQLIRPLDSLSVIEIILKAVEPHRHWTLMMDCLEDTPPLPNATLAQLKRTAWVPLTNGAAAKPEDILHLPRLHEDVARLVAEYPGVFVDPQSLAEDFRARFAYPRFISEIVPGLDDALSMLGTLLLEDPKNAVGSADITFEDWLAAFQADDGALFPQIALLKALGTKHLQAGQSTFGVLKQPVSDSRTQQFLTFLEASHRRDRGAGRKLLVRVFGKYLRQLLLLTGYEVGVASARFPALDGQWKSPRELTLANDGISPSCVIDRHIEEEIADLLPIALQKQGHDSLDDGSTTRGFLSSREPDWNVPAAAQRLRSYFDRWRDLIPNEQIGGFLALLGDDPAMQALAEEYLGRNRTLEETRDKFSLPAAVGGRDETGNPLLEDAPTMIRKQRVVVEIADEPTVVVLNLLGEEFAAPRNERPATLFVGYGKRNNPFPHRIEQGLRIRCFRLNVIDPTAFNESELSALLRDSAAKFIREAYNSLENQTRFLATWDDLASSDQLDIRIAQSRIIEHGFLILAQYGLRSDPVLARVLERWDLAERLKLERESQMRETQSRQSRNPDREMAEARAELRRLFEEPPTTHTQYQVLAAVKQRISDHYQYKPSSIPFELFQNADDAYAELRQFFGRAEPADSPHERTFEIVMQPTRLVFVHFGRRINQYPIDADSTAHGFDSDLWKMSVLSLSNKGQSEDAKVVPVTGKFGLGFKSVFLACDRPRLLSGRLAFEFIGGIYPRRLIGEARRDLDELRTQLAHAEPQATVIALDLRGELLVEDVAKRFLKLAHILVVFARQIRRCICGSDRDTVTWQPIDVPGVFGCRSGDLTPLPVSGHKGESIRVLQFHSDAGECLFALGSHGIESFPSEIPSIWVMAPTEEVLQLGFLINGRFALDVGRAQLARDPAQNQAAALRLGRSFGKQLEEFFLAFQDPSSRSAVRHSLRLAADTQAFDIWSSLWERLVVAVSERTGSDQPADELIRDMLWASLDSGVAHFYSQSAAIPVRLPGKRFEMDLVSLANVRFAIRGVLAQRDRRPTYDGYALACVCGWPKFRDRVGNGMLVSHDRVFRPLERLCADLVQHIQVISISEILGWELLHCMVAPEQAEQFGALLTREFLSLIADPAEANRLRDILDTIEFLANDGHYHPARELLIGYAPPAEGGWGFDESLRTGFAPPSRVLNKQYTQTALRFFVSCREKLAVSAQEMAVWVRAAQDHVTRKAALVYLADGEAGRTVQMELSRQGLESTWLVDLATLPCFRELSAAQQHRLADLLSRHDANGLLDELLRGVPTVPRANPRIVLRAIHDWWVAEGAGALREYEGRVYPNGGLPSLAHPTDEHGRRKDWVTLFLLGLTHTMGRTVAEQHRSFLRQCEHEGWLDMIASSERDSANWMRWIDTFLDGQLDDSRFLQWMKQFVGIYQVSRHLDDYIEAFLAVQRFRDPFPLTQLTNTRSSAQFQAGGVSAPPLSRVLGMGQCFVLRELFRHGVLSNPLAHPHCFVPVARVRRMLVDLGCEALLVDQRPWEWSRVIFNFLQEHLGDAATFQGAFDIPLQVVAEDGELQMQFFAATIDSEDEESALWFDDDSLIQPEDN